MRPISAMVTSRWLHSPQVAAALMVMAVLACLWPLGVGGMMPVGGDVTQFFLGLMGFLHASLRAGRLPVWNDLWGYGFPGLAESQMGVFYPIHLVLYGWCNTEVAYVVSLVAHTLWGALGAFWLARRLGVSGAGAGLAAFSWSACGFFLIHLAHPWGYTTGCWMPWAWGLAWQILAPSGPGKPMAPFLLSLVLALQVLPGHFQMAFITQVVVLLMTVWAGAEALGRRALGEPARGMAVLGQTVRCGVAVAAVFPLTAIQVWPTARLAALAEGRRDFEYLSGFAATPFHLVNYVAPGLFHRSRLWRPLVWDPFHTSPEEQLAYIGLVPLCLACIALWRGCRRDPVVRLLAVVAAATLVLSLGPYVPGFRLLIQIPGFSFFRAPSRWSAATALALALLAGKGFDRWSEWAQSARVAWWFTIAAVVWIAMTVGLIELALASTARTSQPELARTLERAFRAMPWTEGPGFRAVMNQARQPIPDPRIPPGMPQPIMVFATERFRIYGTELLETAGLLMALAAIGRLGRRRVLAAGAVRTALVVLTLVDLWVLSQHRLVDVGPLRPLEAESPVLARLAAEPRGTRVANGGFRNLPMLVGLAPVAAYRTLDLPAVEELAALTRGPSSGPVFGPLYRAATRATGVGVRVFDPIETRHQQLLKGANPSGETITDPALAGWLFGRSWVAEQGPWARQFAVWRAPAQPARAWFVARDAIDDTCVLDNWSGDPRAILNLFEDAVPLDAQTARPEEWTITVRADQPGFLIITQLADPQWKATWLGPDGEREHDAEILPTFQTEREPGGWQRVAVPRAGRWTLRLEYSGDDLVEGMVCSTVAWICWISAALVTGIRARIGRSASGREQTEG